MDYHRLLSQQNSYIDPEYLKMLLKMSVAVRRLCYHYF